MPETSKQIVTNFLEAMEQSDYASALQLVAPDCDYVNPPPFGAVKGPAGIRAVLEPFFAPVLENRFELKRVASDGDAVFVERLDRHRLEDKWVELPVTGVFEVRNGLIVYCATILMSRRLCPSGPRWRESQGRASGSN